MTTARDLLLLDILNVIQSPFSATHSQNVTSMLDRYRVQAKPGTNLGAGLTAREALGDELVSHWQTGHGKDIEEQVKNAIDRYRMQLKQNYADKPPKKVKVQASAGDDQLGKNDDKKNAAKNDGPKSKKKKESKRLSEDEIKGSEPVAGGPQKRNRSRGQCPKCHSMGVVLARSYSGDEYFSCIYCGFQAYRAQLDSELDLPLAAELLGRRFDEKDEILKEEE